MPHGAHNQRANRAWSAQRETMESTKASSVRRGRHGANRHGDQRGQHSVAPGTWSKSLPSSCHPPKLLIRKSATSACSGASTLRDQQLGRVTGGRRRKKRERRGEAPPAPEHISPMSARTSCSDKKFRQNLTLRKQHNHSPPKRLQKDLVQSAQSRRALIVLFSSKHFRVVASARTSKPTTITWIRTKTP